MTHFFIDMMYVWIQLEEKRSKAEKMNAGWLPFAHLQYTKSLQALREKKCSKNVCQALVKGLQPLQRI